MAKKLAEYLDAKLHSTLPLIYEPLVHDLARTFFRREGWRINRQEVIDILDNHGLTADDMRPKMDKVRLLLSDLAGGFRDRKENLDLEDRTDAATPYYRLVFVPCPRRVSFRNQRVEVIKGLQLARLQCRQLEETLGGLHDTLSG